MRRWLISAMLSLALSAPCGAGQRVLNLVTGTDYPPYVDADLPDGGPLVTLVKAVFHTTGDPVELSVEPWRRGYEGLLAGRFDATFPYVRTAERDRDVLYSDPLLVVRQHLIVATGNRMAAMEAGWLNGKRVCNAVGYGLPPWLDAMITAGQAQRVTPTQQRSCMAMIAADRADFMVEDERIANARLTSAGEREQVAVVPGPPASKAELYLIVARSNPDGPQILARFNQGLTKLRADGLDPLGPKPRS